MKRKVTILPLLLLTVVTGVAQAQPDINNPAKAANPAGVVQWDRQKIMAVFEKNLKDYLDAVGVKDTATHKAVLAYFTEAHTQDFLVTATPAVELHESARALSEAIGAPNATDQSLTTAIDAYDASLLKFHGHRSEAAAKLDAEIGFSKNRKLQAALTLIGVGTDAPPFILTTALFGLDANKLPVSAAAPLPRAKASVHLWTSIVDPAGYTTMSRYITRIRVKHILKAADAEATTQGAVLAFVNETEMAKQLLDDNAMPLYHALISPHVFPEQAEPEAEVQRLLDEYSLSLDQYAKRMKQAHDNLEAQTKLSAKPRFKANLLIGGFLHNGPSVLPDPATHGWTMQYWTQLYGREVK